MRQRSPVHLKAASLYKGTLMPRSLVIAIGISLSLNLVSCDLFKTRTPEEPSQQSSNYVPPTDASLVLQNMVNAFKDRDVVNYSKSFSEASFSFEPATSARTRYGGVFMTWDKTKEQQYFENVKNSLQQNSTMTLEFIPLTSTNYQDSCEIGTSYHLNVPHTRTTVAKYFTGQSQFTIIRDPQIGYWYISRWVDVAVNPSDSTWSDLKGVFAR
jgi:hypothetical protein